jgi:N,N-dimethylformamidase
MNVLGYTDRLSVSPGQKIRFMVSCDLPSYRAELVRLIHGDLNPIGPGFKAEPVRAKLNGEYPGIKKKIELGSYLVVENGPRLPVDSFTLQAWIRPTTPRKGLQGIVTKWSGADRSGYGLFIDEKGELTFRTKTTGGHATEVKTGKPLTEHTWYFVAACYDKRRGTVSLYQEPSALGIEASVFRAKRVTDRIEKNDSHLMIAAYADSDAAGNPTVRGFYNGKIESPRIFGRAFALEGLRKLRDGPLPKAIIKEHLIAAWDFAHDAHSSRIKDTSPNDLHGRAINFPTRGVTGHNWTGKEVDFKRAPGEYQAIHFHDDDQGDAGWSVDFEFVVPKGIKSGIYAAHLISGGYDDYVPFFVRPRKGRPKSKIALLIPTLSYLAYSNEHLAERAAEVGLGTVHNYPSQPEDVYVVQNRLSSLYDLHSDGSGVCYVSRLRPLVNMRPSYVCPSIANGHGAPHQFGDDLHLVDWLEAKGYSYDVITDEDLHYEGSQLISSYNVLLSGTHPEYWTARMLDALETYLSGGGRVMYLGGNGFYWVTTINPESPFILEVRRWHGTGSWQALPGEYYHSTTGELGGLWRDRGRPPQKLVGIGMTAQGIDVNRPYRRLPGSLDKRVSFIFEGIGDDELIGNFQSLVQDFGAAGHEIDRMDYALGTPSNAILLATATGFSDSYQHVIEENIASDDRQGGTTDPLVRADMVYADLPEGGAIFSVGSIAWCGSLFYNKYDNNVSRIMGNVLRKFSR